MAEDMQTNSNSFVSWVALIIAVLALILGWVAYNRTGVDLTEQIEAEVSDALIEVGAEIEEAEDTVREGTANTLEEGAQELEEGAMDARTDER